MNDDKKGYVLYKNWNPIFLSLPDSKAGQLIKAIAAYQDGEQMEPLKDQSLNGVFEMMKRAFDMDAAKYAEIKEKRSAAGKKGGRPSKKKDESENQTKAKESNCFSEKPKKADKVKGKDIDKVIDKGIDNSRPPPRFNNQRDKNPFNRFEQNNYDFEQLEQELLSNQAGSGAAVTG